MLNHLHGTHFRLDVVKQSKANCHVQYSPSTNRSPIHPPGSLFRTSVPAKEQQQQPEREASPPGILT